MPVECRYQPNRTNPRRYSAQDVGRIARYALRSGATPADILAAVALELQKGAIANDTSALPSIFQSPGSADPLFDALASIRDTIPLVGVPYDTVKSVFDRFHNLAQRISPGETADFDAWLSSSSQSVLKATQPIHDVINDTITKATTYVDELKILADSWRKEIDQPIELKPGAVKNAIDSIRSFFRGKE